MKHALNSNLIYLAPRLSLLDPGGRLILADDVVEMEEPADQDLPLDAERRHQEVEGPCGAAGLG